MRILVNERLSEHRVKTPEGYLICMDAILARTGKQTYRHNEIFRDSDDESEIEIDRPEAEVFSDKTLASFENKPITDEHPDEDVTVLNYKDHAIGFVRDIRRAKDGDQDVMIGNLVITDKDAIEEIESGERTELSCGYDCEIADDNGHYIQKNIRGNHVALCEHGRAGNARIIDSNNIADVKIDERSFDECLDILDRNNIDWSDASYETCLVWFDNEEAAKKAQAVLQRKHYSSKVGSFTNRRGHKSIYIELTDSNNVDDAQMHTYEICYIDYGEVCIAIVAKSEQDAIRKFRRDYGYYTIVHVKQKDSINDAAKFYVVICENNDVYIAESIDRAKRLAKAWDGDVYEIDGNIEFYRQTLKKFGQRAAFDEWWNDRRKGKARLVDARYEYYIIESASGQHLSEGGRLTMNPNDYREVEDRDEAERLARLYSQKLGVQLYVKKDFYIDSVNDAVYVVELYKSHGSDPIRKTFQSYAMAMDFGKSESKTGKWYEIYVNRRTTNGPSTENSWERGYGWYKDSVDDAIVEPDTNDLKGLEKIFEQNGFKVESLKKNIFSGYHYQIRSTQTYPKEKFKETVVQITRKIDAYKNKTDCSITWNFGHMDDGTITAGVDVHDKYVKNSVKDKDVETVYRDPNSKLYIEYDGKMFYVASDDDVDHRMFTSKEDTIKYLNNWRRSLIKNLLGDSVKTFKVTVNNKSYKVSATSPKDAVKRVARLK